jgi:uncharacterized membrane protein SpoIIM required for sporulation
VTPQALRRWLETRRADWARIEAQLQQAHPHLDGEAALAQTVGDYRTLAHDVAVARRELPGSEVTLRLEGWLRHLHFVIHRDYEPLRERLLRLYRDEIPNLFRRLLPTLRVLALLFIASAVAAAVLVWCFPELAALFASERMIAKVENGELWTQDLLNVVPSSVASAGIITNNITVALMSFVLGVLYGIGTLYMVMLNGAMLGGSFAFTARYGLAGALFRFIVAHGVVELSVILLAASAGVGLGEALARPGQRTRIDAFRAAVADGGRLLAVVVPFLGLAGVIEGFISPTDFYSIPVRMLIGTIGGWLLWTVLSGRAWRRRV